ncbi:MAG: FHA domain-containing protein [Planctomycetota bacterium]
MARLIVEEGGQERRFKLNPGTLTIGSGQSATLTLEFSELAEVHAEIEFDGECAVLRLRPGVTPVTLYGRKVAGELKLKDGVAVELGGVQITFESDSSKPVTAAPATVARAGATRPATRPARRRRVQASTPGRVASGVGTRRPGQVEHKRRTITRSAVPTWAVVAMILGAAGIGLIVFQKFAVSSAERGFSAKASQVRLDDMRKEGDFLGMLSHLDEIQDAPKSAEWAKKFADYRAETIADKERGSLLALNVHGNKYVETQLKSFVDKYLKRSSRPAARILLERIQGFRAKYPLHPELAWCSRMEARYGTVANLATPPTWEDLDFRVTTLTWAMPRDYRQAFSRLERFLTDASPGDRDKALDLIDELETAREDYFLDRIQQAKYLWKGDEQGKALEWLVQLVIKVGDSDMAFSAAREIVAMHAAGDIVPALRGYKSTRPEDFELLMEQEILRRFAEEHGVR